MSLPYRFHLALMLLIGSATISSAVPITYKVTSTASGTIGAQTFSNAFITVTTTGNTADVVARTFDPGDGSTYTAYFDPNVTTTVTITGIGTATITMPTGILSFPTPIGIDSDFPAADFVLIARLDEVGPGDITGIALVGGDALLNYHLTSSLGPITSVGGIGYPSGDPLSTTLGNLAFASNIVPTTTGTFTATVATTPEPSSLLLISGGILAIAFRARRKRG